MHHRVPILIIADDRAVTAQITNLLSETPWPTVARVFPQTAEAFTFLHKDDLEPISRPALIVLSCDLGPNGAHAQHFLRALRADRQLCDIPVIALTTGKEDQMTLVFYTLYADARLALHRGRLPDVLARTCRHWLQKQRAAPGSFTCPRHASFL